MKGYRRRNIFLSSQRTTTAAGVTATSTEKLVPSEKRSAIKQGSKKTGNRSHRELLGPWPAEPLIKKLLEWTKNELGTKKLIRDARAGGTEGISWKRTLCEKGKQRGCLGESCKGCDVMPLPILPRGRTLGVIRTMLVLSIAAAKLPS